MFGAIAGRYDFLNHFLSAEYRPPLEEDLRTGSARANPHAGSKNS